MQPVILPAKVTIKSVTDQILESMPVGTEFTTQDLQRAVNAEIFRRTGQIRKPFHDTVLRYLRYERADGECDFRCTSRERSTYVKESMTEQLGGETA